MKEEDDAHYNKPTADAGTRLETKIKLKETQVSLRNVNPP